jgi:NAD(P)-dependent dehydrogenase (short-subunit alcohol dehydrogenase family)
MTLPKATLPYMIKQKQGSIVNVVSIQALAGMMNDDLGSLHRDQGSSLLGYMLSAAYDYGSQNIRVNSLCPVRFRRASRLGPAIPITSGRPITRSSGG